MEGKQRAVTGLEVSMREYKHGDIVKEVVWNLFVYVLYYVWCFFVLLLVHFLLYRLIPAMKWTVRDIGVYALAGSTAIMVVRIVGKIRKMK